MRVTVGAIAVLGFAVTVAAAQPPARDRAVEFKAPQALQPGERPPVARGAGEDFPTSPYLSSTPVPRMYDAGRTPAASGGPRWLSGVDPNVLPAGASVPPTGSGGVRPLTPPAGLPADPAAPPKLIDRWKGFVGGEKPPTVKAAPQQLAQADQPTSGAPFRATGSDGAPVYAGPPAYRWYGWGTVTPGANPLAPAGQYPRASANWYAITGATPGAFPVPAGNTALPPPGTEPPTYGLSRSQPVPQPTVPVAVQPRLQTQPAPPALERPEPAPINTPLYPASGSRFTPAPTPAPVTPPVLAPVSVPTIPTPPVTKPAAVARPTEPPTDVPVPVVSAPPVPPMPAVATPEPAVARPLPAAPAPPPAPAVEPVKPISVTPTGEQLGAPLPAVTPKPLEVTPSPLPTSVTEKAPREDLRWQRDTEPTPPPPGSWTPAPGMAPLPAQEPTIPSGQTGSAKVMPVVARGRMNESTPDAVAALIKQVCQGRADGVEVRWTGAKKLSVCFEIRTAAAAQKLVAEISRRPELTAYQIDFCVLVK